MLPKPSGWQIVVISRQSCKGRDYTKKKERGQANDNDRNMSDETHPKFQTQKHMKEMRFADICVCLCVCERETARETEPETERETETTTEIQTKTESERDANIRKVRHWKNEGLHYKDQPTWTLSKSIGLSFICMKTHAWMDVPACLLFP